MNVTRLPLELRPDPSRSIVRFFRPGNVNRVRGIIERALAIPEADLPALVDGLTRTFSPRHGDIGRVFGEHFETVRPFLPAGAAPSASRRALIGACFTMEYALEAVALFNPSIVPATHQESAAPGSVRFLMSLRAIGEGHVSSVVFRVGTIDADGNVAVDPPGRYPRTTRAVPPSEYERSTFINDLEAFSPIEGLHRAVLDRLGDRFTAEELSDAIEAARHECGKSGHFEEAVDTLVTASRVNYRLEMPDQFGEAEVVIFPFSDIERHGIEDLRLVRFTEEGGETCYYGTYTAFNGVRVYPQLLKYQPGERAEVGLITGKSAKNKGMALFPRRIGGRFAMIARLDNENLFYMESDDIRVWDDADFLQAPRYPWQVIQIGNCGSPLETEAGWLLLTHGVGPMRQYCIGATLLDREDPRRVLAQTREPLLMPGDEGRAGYVPNVVYTCGAMVHGRFLIIPYATSDSVTGFARVELGELIASLERV